jgi:protein TonB
MNGKGIKYAAALTGAALITLGLFLLMTRMITGAAGTGPQAQHYNAVDFVRLVPDKHPQEKPRDKLPEKKPPPKPPPPPKLSAAQPDAPPPPDTAMPMPAIDTDLRLTGGPVIGRLAPGAASPAKDDEVIPLVRVPPVYPTRAERLRLGGTVVVEFTINAVGRVEGAKVVSSKPSRIFDQAALQAILRWRFKPKLEDGKPVQRRARQRFEFTPPR